MSSWRLGGGYEDAATWGGGVGERTRQEGGSNSAMDSRFWEPRDSVFSSPLIPDSRSRSVGRLISGAMDWRKRDKRRREREG